MTFWQNCEFIPIKFSKVLAELGFIHKLLILVLFPPLRVAKETVSPASEYYIFPYSFSYILKRLLLNHVKGSDSKVNKLDPLRIALIIKVVSDWRFQIDL